MALLKPLQRLQRSSSANNMLPTAWHACCRPAVSLRRPQGLPSTPFSTLPTCLRAWSRGRDTYISAKKQGAPQIPLTPDGLRLQATFAGNTGDPVATLRERLQAGTADLELARVCLEVYYTRLIKLSRRERRQRIRHDNVAALTIEWLWSDSERWSRAVTQDVNRFQGYVTSL